MKPKERNKILEDDKKKEVCEEVAACTPLGIFGLRGEGYGVEEAVAAPVVGVLSNADGESMPSSHGSSSTGGYDVGNLADVGTDVEDSEDEEEKDKFLRVANAVWKRAVAAVARAEEVYEEYARNWLLSGGVSTTKSGSGAGRNRGSWQLS